MVQSVKKLLVGLKNVCDMMIFKFSNSTEKSPLHMREANIDYKVIW